MRKTKFTRIVAFMMAIVMLVGIVPAYAADGGGTMSWVPDKEYDDEPVVGVPNGRNWDTALVHAKCDEYTCHHYMYSEIYAASDNEFYCDPDAKYGVMEGHFGPATHERKSVDLSYATNADGSVNEIIYNAIANAGGQVTIKVPDCTTGVWNLFVCDYHYEDNTTWSWCSADKPTGWMLKEGYRDEYLNWVQTGDYGLWDRCKLDCSWYVWVYEGPTGHSDAGVIDSYEYVDEFTGSTMRCDTHKCANCDCTWETQTIVTEGCTHENYTVSSRYDEAYGGYLCKCDDCGATWYTEEYEPEPEAIDEPVYYGNDPLIIVDDTNTGKGTPDIIVPNVTISDEPESIYVGEAEDIVGDNWRIQKHGDYWVLDRFDGNHAWVDGCVMHKWDDVKHFVDKHKESKACKHNWVDMGGNGDGTVFQVCTKCGAEQNAECNHGKGCAHSCVVNEYGDYIYTCERCATEIYRVNHEHNYEYDWEYREVENVGCYVDYTYTCTICGDTYEESELIHDCAAEGHAYYLEEIDGELVERCTWCHHINEPDHEHNWVVDHYEWIDMTDKGYGVSKITYWTCTECGTEYETYEITVEPGETCTHENVEVIGTYYETVEEGSDYVTYEVTTYKCQDCGLEFEGRAELSREPISEPEPECEHVWRQTNCTYDGMLYHYTYRCQECGETKFVVRSTPIEECTHAYVEEVRTYYTHEIEDGYIVTYEWTVFWCDECMSYVTENMGVVARDVYEEETKEDVTEEETHEEEESEECDHWGTLESYSTYDAAAGIETIHYHCTNCDVEWTEELPYDIPVEE